ncbi:hypothetical protein [uncultured Alistipes sp.]|jgi:hypothetical protein|uniref:hypothetical protein n=1 Tax=uncultured Alistipes sp. TaxID=538949 RepID=UPI0025E4980B|nr:hypothetical protein [uncultured Alistipes sp.]
MNERKHILPGSANYALHAAYTAPQIHILNVDVELGFAGSVGLGSDVNGWEDGGVEEIGVY